MEPVHNGFSKAGNSHGYTGHEHLPWFGLVNMNARLYDPALGRFLSPDPEVQQPDGTQGFNRYSYCLNNPLRYVDLDGERYYRNKDSRIAQMLTSVLTDEIRLSFQELDKITDDARKSHLNDRIQEMYKSIRDLQDMYNDDMYFYMFGDANDNGGITETAPTAFNLISIYTDGFFNNLIHETRHGGQLARREFAFAANGKPDERFGASHEIDAYRAQLGYANVLTFYVHDIIPFVIRTMNDITNGFLRSITVNRKFLYRNYPEEWYNR